MADLSAQARPDDELLAARLRTVLARNYATSDLRIVAREPLGSGTSPKEIVTCILGDRRELKVFCKYAAQRDNSYGHRDGIAYEAEVYSRVLTPSTARTPELIGSFVDPESGEESLFLEYIEGSLRAHKAPEAMGPAARWAGRFHAEAEAGLLGGVDDLLLRYDPDYFAGWSRRTLLFARRAGLEWAWLERVARHYEELIPLFASQPTIVHGEYTVKNVLAQEGTIIPTDWESAAIGPGEIDLACLTDGWSDETVALCVREYANARWPKQAWSGFEERLEAAVLYVNFRWLGEDAAALREYVDGSRIDSLRRLAEELDGR